MRPKKKRVGDEQPDASKENAEVNETIGGTNGEGMGDDEDWGRTVPDDDLAYGRPEPEEDEQPF